MQLLHEKKKDHHHHSQEVWLVYQVPKSKIFVILILASTGFGVDNRGQPSAPNSRNNDHYCRNYGDQVGVDGMLKS